MKVFPGTISYLRERSTTSRVVDDVRDDTLDVAMALGVVNSAELGSTLAVGVMRLEDGPASLSLCPDHATHLKEGKKLRGAEFSPCKLLIPPRNGPVC